MSSTVLACEGLSKSFRVPSVARHTVREHVFGLLRRRKFERLDVLRDVGFEVKTGQSLGIMGRNGSGKSTLLKIVCGIYRPDAGTVRVEGALTPILELGVGWNADLDAIDNILLIGTAMGMTLAEARAATNEILAFAELERFARLELKHYSNGMAARLAYAIAFSSARDALVLDEIFAVGDVSFKERCMARFREMHAQGRTVVLVSHDPAVIKTFCDHAILLEAGRILVEGSGAQVSDGYLKLMTSRPPLASAG